MSKFVDKVLVEIMPTADGEIVEFSEEMREDFRRAGWSDDPGTGRAIHDRFGREIVNPVPMAPPVGYIQEVSVMDQVMQRLLARQRILAEDAIRETAADADDFDVEDDFDPFSLYEVTEMRPDAPPLPIPVEKPVEAVVTPPLVPTKSSS